ncbi:MAG: DUF3795 domain-containing protein [Spirochaetota bacterium]
MKSMTAYCGIDCAKCEGYIATQANDRKAIEGVAEKWRKQYNSPDITAESVICDGCTKDNRLSGYCNYVCKIRPCAREKKVENCAYCPDYNTCKELAAFYAYPAAAEAKATLEQEYSKNK